MNLLSYLIPQTLATYQSDFNGSIEVKEFFGRQYIEVGGLMQSGKIPERLFRKGIKRLLKINKQFSLSQPTSSNSIKKILLLGLGAGTVVKLLNKYISHAKITAVDIDPVIVQVGKKHFGLGELKNLRIVIGDVFSEKTKLGSGYDAIIVDVFRGYEVPQELSSESFLLKLKSLLNKSGIIMFNRLYFDKYKSQADEFIKVVKKDYSNVDLLKDYFNILIYTF